MSRASLEKRVIRLEQAAERRRQAGIGVVQFTVVRLMPDPIAGECINIGIVVLDGDKVFVAPLRNWTRVYVFASKEACDLARDFVSTELLQFSATDIRWHAENASGIIQYAPLQPSLEQPLDLLSRLAKRYLKEPA